MRWLAGEFGKRLGAHAQFEGSEAPTAWLLDTRAGAAPVRAAARPLEAMIDWVADWVARGMPALGKATHFYTRDGNTDCRSRSRRRRPGAGCRRSSPRRAGTRTRPTGASSSSSAADSRRARPTATLAGTAARAASCRRIRLDQHGAGGESVPPPRHRHPAAATLHRYDRRTPGWCRCWTRRPPAVELYKPLGYSRRLADHALAAHRRRAGGAGTGSAGAARARLGIDMRARYARLRRATAPRCSSGCVSVRAASPACARPQGSLRGFLLGREGRVATQLGPIVAEDEDGERSRSRRWANARLAPPVIVDALDRHHGLADWLAVNGFAKERPYTRMTLGARRAFRRRAPHDRHRGPGAGLGGAGRCTGASYPAMTSWRCCGAAR